MHYLDLVNIPTCPVVFELTLPDFNVLLLLVPVSFALQRFSAESDTLIFICMTFSLAPWVIGTDIDQSASSL